MQADFWVKRWEQGKTGFHRTEFNEYLLNHWAELGLEPSASVLVPLSGKSLDMLWLSGRGHTVHGSELSQVAVEEFFRENDLQACHQDKGKLVHWQCGRNHLWHGDFFDLGPGDTGKIDAVYDRAALVALPPGVRPRYATHLQEIAQGAPILLVTLEYDEDAMAGPPFSVTGEEVKQLFGSGYVISLLSDNDILATPENGKFRERGVNYMREKVYKLVSA